jgi:hypothetical protein
MDRWLANKSSPAAADDGGGRPAKKQKTDPAPPRPVFLLAAGAGGVLPKESPVHWLEQVGKVTCPSIEGESGFDPQIGKIKGVHGCKASTLKRYRSAVEAVCSAHPTRDVWLVGQSFGCGMGI